MGCGVSFRLASESHFIENPVLNLTAVNVCDGKVGLVCTGEDANIMGLDPLLGSLPRFHRALKYNLYVNVEHFFFSKCEC